MSAAPGAFSAVQAYFAQQPPARLGVAVSGGGDSTALLLLLSDWSGSGGPELRVVTVDHGLRPEAAAEADAVCRLSADLGIGCDRLNWRWDGTGNLADQARRGRYGLMAEWAAGHDLRDVALGHTLDDVAETFLMRLSRGAGLDGLAAMAPSRVIAGVTFHRPLLEVSRAALRDVLTARDVGWAEDPGNADESYLRSRARAALQTLGPLGIEAGTLAAVAGHLADARAALGVCALRVSERTLRFDQGDIVIDWPALRTEPSEIVRRVLLAALRWVGGAEYPARGPALARVLALIEDGESATLQGCRLLRGREGLRITREAAALEGLRAPVTALWDGRWQLRFAGDPGPGLHVAALTEAGLPLCPDRKTTGRPAASLVASPAVWRGDTLVAAPLAGLENGWSATCLRTGAAFKATLLSH